MNATETIPITVEPEAATRIAELVFSEHMDRMIDHARETVPQIQRIEVVMNYRYDDPSPDGVYIHVWSDHSCDPDLKDWEELTSWMIETFPPEVLEHLGMCYYRC